MVILEATREGFAPNVELMRADAPTASEVLTMLRESRDAGAWRDYTRLGSDEFLPASQAVMHRYLADMIYNGNAALGLEMLETGWPPFIPGREEYVRDLQDVLKKSPYWNVIAELNPGTIFGQ